MRGHVTKVISVDAPVEIIFRPGVQIQPTLKSFLLNVWKPQRNNSNITTVNSVTDNNCNKSRTFLCRQKLYEIEIEGTTKKLGYLIIYSFIHFHVDLHPTHKTNSSVPVIKTILRNTTLSYVSFLSAHGQIL
jgi:hypothetical protein